MGGDSYNTMRSPNFRDYEQFPYGTIEGSTNSRKTYYAMVQEKKEQHKNSLKKGNGKKICPFCAEHKKKPLGVYLRKRKLSTRDEKICEEEESYIEEEDEGEECNENHKHETQNELNENERKVQHPYSQNENSSQTSKNQTKTTLVSSF
jgi:hypothetical protein